MTLEDQGYVICRQVIAPGMLGAIRETLAKESVKSKPDAGALESFFPRIAERCDASRSALLSDLILERVYGVLGRRVHLLMNYGHIKPAHSCAHTVLHSDVAHLPSIDHARATLIVKCMIALNDVAEHGGAVGLIPGSHKDAADHSNRNALLINGLSSGDVLLFNAAVLHTSTANTSSSDRLSLWAAYGHEWMRQMPGFETSKNFLRRLRKSPSTLQAQLFGLSNPYDV